MRKLALFSAGFALAVFAAHYFIPKTEYLLCAAICAGLFLAALFWRATAGIRARIVCLALAAGFSLSFASYRFTELPAEGFAGSECEVEAVITEYPAVYDNYALVTARLRGDAPHVRVMAYGDFAGCVPGDVVSFSASFKSASVRYGEPWDGYTAQGVYLVAYGASDIRVTGRSAASFLYFPQRLAKTAAAALTELMPEREGGFIKALLLGDKSGLYEDDELYCSLSDAGILHIVAVSGMHVAFLLGFLRLILRRKKTVALIGIPVIWIFAYLAGASPSVLRAAFMQTMVLTAPLLRRESDGLTSLSLALMLLLAVNPEACASASLQLSFSAMLGMILFTGKINRAVTAKLKDSGLHKHIKRALFAVASSLSASLGAMAFTVPLMALHFGYVALYSILVNIIIFWAVSAAFVLGGITAILGCIWLPLGSATAWAAVLLARYICGVSEFAAHLPYAMLVTENNAFAWAVALVYIIVGTYALLKRRRRLSAALPVCLSICVFCAVIVYTELDTASSLPELTALDVGQGQSVVMTEGKTAVMVDCGGKGTARNAGETAAKALLAQGRRKIDILALTHFDADHVNGVSRLMCRIRVENLVIPDESCQARDEIVAEAQEQGTKVYIIDKDETFSIAGIKLTAFRPVSKAQPELIFLASSGECDILITGDADEETEQRFLLSHDLPDTEILIAGHHGSKHASTQELLAAAKAETAIISVGYNSYGHPTDETLSRLSQAGMTIMRTDELGSITLPFGD